MRKCAPAFAASLAACASLAPHPQGASRSQFEVDLREYVEANWDGYVARMQRMNGWPSGQLELIDLTDLDCSHVGGAVTCAFQIAARSQSGDISTATVWGSFGYHNGQLGEVIVVG